MKSLLLIIHQIQDLIKNHKAFSILLVTAQLLGILILLFSAATIQSISVKQKKLDEMSLFFEVSTLKYLDEQEEIIMGYNEVDGKSEPIYGTRNKVDLSSGLSIKEVTDRVKTIIAENPIDDRPIVRIYGYYNDYRIGTYLLDDSGIETGEITLNCKRIPGYKIGESYKIGDKCLIITNIVDNLITDMLVSSTDIPNEWLGYNIRFIYSTAPTTEQAEKMKSLLMKYFDCNELYIPETVDPLTAQFNYMAILCTFLMLIAVLINICYAQLYRFRLSKLSFSVFRLVGCSVKNICSLCYSEILITSILLYTLGTIVFNYLFKNSISLWYESVDSLYTTKYYMLFGIAYFILQLIIISLPLKRFVSQEVVTAEKEDKL